MGQDTSRAALAARDIESQNYDQIAKDLRDEVSPSCHSGHSLS